MIQKIKSWMNENGVSIAFVGGALVIITQWATCTLEPNLVSPDKQTEEVQDVKED